MPEDVGATEVLLLFLMGTLASNILQFTHLPTSNVKKIFILFVQNVVNVRENITLFICTYM